MDERAFSVLIALKAALCLVGEAYRWEKSECAEDECGCYFSCHDFFS
jgi:hypothetical protein